jgi:hypothetical protein
MKVIKKKKLYRGAGSSPVDEYHLPQMNSDFFFFWCTVLVNFQVFLCTFWSRLQLSFSLFGQLGAPHTQNLESLEILLRKVSRNPVV